MASDGKVVICTELDNSGVEKGVKTLSGQLSGLGSTLKSIASMLAAAFSTKKIVEFAAESSQAARTMSDALTGLKSILEGQGRSFSDAQDFIESYTEDGLIPATNAINAYKNLASRGYDDSQIKQVMTALKDASAYGRQANYTMGEAVESATEGLKNENSILVDNAGVTKNVAKMWDEYAASIGTTANNLTQEQKIQAEVSGILAETKYQTGDAATVAGTLSGQLQQLSFRFNDLKVAVGNAINPVIQTFLPIINTAITAVTKFANAIASVVGALFGKTSVQTSTLADSNNSVASSASAGAAAEQELADATEAAGKAAKKSLAPFDELNTLQSSAGGGGSSASGSSGTGSPGGNSIAVETQVEDTLSPKLQAIVDKVKGLIEPLKQIDFTPAVEAFGRLKEAIAPLTAKLFEGLEWAWNNILVPLAEWTIEDALPAFLDLLSAALDLLNVAIEGLQPLGQWLWDEFLKPMAEWTADITIDYLKDFTDLLQDLSDLLSGETSFGDFLSSLSPAQTALAGIAASPATISTSLTVISTVEALKTLPAFFSSVMNLTASGAIGKLAEVIAIVTTGAGSLAEAMTLIFGTVTTTIAGIAAIIGGAVLAVTNFFTMLSNGFNWLNEALMIAGIAIAAVGAIILGAPAIVAGVVAAIVAVVATVIVAIVNYADEIKNALNSFASWLKNIFARDWTEVFGVRLGTVLNLLVGIIGGVLGGLKEMLFGLLDFIQGVFTGNWGQAWNGIVGIVKGAINLVIGVVNGMISAVVNGINAVFRLLSFNIPLPGGGSIGWTLPQLTAPQIPYLAQGAVLPANKPFLAMVGDQKHGTNIEAPLDTIKQAVAEVLATGEQNSLLREQNELLRQILEKTGVTLDGKVISDVVTSYQRRNARALGG